MHKHRHRWALVPLAVASVAVAGCSAPADDHTATATIAVTTTDVSPPGTVKALASEPCQVVPDAVRREYDNATAGYSPGALVGFPTQPACTLARRGSYESIVVVLFGSMAPAQVLRAQQQLPMTTGGPGPDLVVFPVPTTDALGASTCITVTDLGPSQGMGVIAQTVTPSDTCTAAEQTLVAVAGPIAAGGL